MAVERLIQKIKLGERQLMQDSMCKLISMISENRKTQEDIIKALPENDIITMMTYLEDPDPYFRKLTAKFFLDLLYGNYAVQQIFCDILGILPCDGKVCINKIPDSFKRTNKSISECLEIMKKGCPEEAKDSLPYCWYYSPESAAGKQVEFISENQRKGIEELDKFVDPLSVMFGFIVKVPKAKKQTEKTTEYVEKTISAKEYEAKRATTAANRKALHAINSSLDQSMQGRLLNDSKSVEREGIKNISPVRGLTASGITSSRVNSRNSKPKVEPLTSPSICNSERANQSKFALTSERGGDASKNIDKEIHKIFGTKRYSIEGDKIKTISAAEVKEKKSPNRVPEFSIDTTDLMQNSKIATSHNDSQDLGLKLESSGIISALSKSSVPMKQSEKSPDFSSYKVANDRKSDILKKNVAKYEKTKANVRASKNTREGTSHSFSMTTTPKNNLLSKILKDKPSVKEVISANKQAKPRQDASKKLNTTNSITVSSPAKHITHKLSIGLNQLKGPSKLELEYANRKAAFHSSLIKSIDMTDLTSTTVLIEEKEESLAKENLNQDDTSERRQSLKGQANPKSKISQLASVLKGTATTPRTPTDILKSTVNQNSKILNARRSQDNSSYLSSLARDKRKSEASIPFQHMKNRYSDLKDSSIVRNSLTEFTLDFTQSTTPKTYIK